MGRGYRGRFCTSFSFSGYFIAFVTLTLMLCACAVPVSANAASAAPQSHQAQGIAHVSWYGHRFQGKLMANGKPFNMYAFTAASKTLPFGTHVILYNPRNGREVTVTITDRGPYTRGRDFDVSWAAARKLGILGKGVSSLEVVSK